MRDGLKLVDVLPLGIRELDIQGDLFWSAEEEVDLLVEFLREDADGEFGSEKREGRIAIEV